MKLGHLNLITALLSLSGAILWMALGNVVLGLVWLGLSAVWAGAAILSLARRQTVEAAPVRRLARRISRMLLWFSVVN